MKQFLVDSRGNGGGKAGVDAVAKEQLAAGLLAPERYVALVQSRMEARATEVAASPQQRKDRQARQSVAPDNGAQRAVTAQSAAALVPPAPVEQVLEQLQLPSDGFSLAWLREGRATLDAELAVLRRMAQAGDRVGAYARFIDGDVAVADVTAAVFGDYAGGLAACRAVCVDGDLMQPSVDESARRLFHTYVGIFSVGAGAPQDAIEHYGKAAALAQQQGNWPRVASSLENMAEAHLYLGDYQGVQRDIAGALAAADKVEDAVERGELRGDAYCYLGAAAMRRGDTLQALEDFARAERERPVESGPLGDIWALWHTEALIASGRPENLEKAADIAQTVHDKALADGNAPVVSQAQRAVASATASRGEPRLAARLFDNAVTVARATTAQHVLIEALIAQGDFLSRSGDPIQAKAGRRALEEASTLAAAGGYYGYVALAGQKLTTS